jgi:uncharacterized protein YbjT (DUF2867 family)
VLKGCVQEAFIDAEDIAELAVAALTEDGHAGRCYELSGPRLMTFGDAVLEITRAAGRDIRYVPLTPEAYADEQRAQGVPEKGAVVGRPVRACPLRRSRLPR